MADGVSYSLRRLTGSEGYLKSTLGEALVANGILGARLLTSSGNTTDSSSSVAPSATPSVLSCPSSNGTAYTDPSGAQFSIECGIDHAAGDMGMSYLNTFAQCVGLCGNTGGCVDVSYRGGEKKSK